MASPQTINGYVTVANELWDALIKYRLPGEQEQCLKVIIRQTYGFNRKTIEIPLDEFVKRTGINKPNVSRALREMINKNIIIVIKKDNRSDSTYGINKNYSTWKSLSKKITQKSLSKKIIIVIKKDNPPIKDKLKDNRGKKRTAKKFTPPAEEEVIKYFIGKGFSESHGKKAYEYYAVADWIDSRGKQVKNWKQKMLANWMKDENKIIAKQESVRIEFPELPT